MLNTRENATTVGPIVPLEDGGSEGEGVCPFCGCLYDHIELLRIENSGDVAALGVFYDRVLAEPVNAGVMDEGTL